MPSNIPTNAPILWEAKKGWFVDLMGAVYGPYKTKKEAVETLEKFYAYMKNRECKNCEDS